MGAFLNIEVDEADRDCLRFLWVNDINSPDPEIVVYRFNRVVFGFNSSPFLLNAVIRCHLSQFRETDPAFTDKLSQSFYADDFLPGNPEEAYDLYCEAKERMMQAGFKLRKWKTNSKLLEEKIAENEGRTEITAQFGQEENSVSKDTANFKKRAS